MVQDLIGLGMGAVQKVLYWKKMNEFSETMTSTVQYQRFLAHGSYCISNSDKCFIVKIYQHVLLHQLGVSPPASLLLNDAKQRGL